MPTNHVTLYCRWYVCEQKEHIKTQQVSVRWLWAKVPASLPDDMGSILGISMVEGEKPSQVDCSMPPTDK